MVLVRPEIPNNTGNIGRTCVATGCAMHLVHPLGFELSEKACRRAGLDYWPRLLLHEHADWPAYERASAGARRWLFSARAGRSLFDADLRPGDHLVFGGETAGLSASLLETEPSRVLGLPMARGERSLNVATVVSVVVYEGIRQGLASGNALPMIGLRSGPE